MTVAYPVRVYYNLSNVSLPETSFQGITLYDPALLFHMTVFFEVMALGRGSGRPWKIESQASPK
jgi:hypothetical protein